MAPETMTILEIGGKGMSRKRKAVLGVIIGIGILVIAVVALNLVREIRYSNLEASLQRVREDYEALCGANKDYLDYVDEMQAAAQLKAAAESSSYISLYEQDGQAFYQDEKITLYLINDPNATVSP